MNASLRLLTGSLFGMLPRTALMGLAGRLPGARAIAGLLLAVTPASTSAQTPISSQANVGVPIVFGQSHVLRSRILGDDRRLAVYLPQGYGVSKRAYPVIYLLDGGAEEDFHHITGLVRVSAAYETTEDAIVIGIEGVDRRHDLTGPTKNPADLKLAPTSGGSAAYRRFLVEELQPWVQRHYRTTGRKALLGESFAGLFVMETVLSQPDAFTDYIAVSPSLWWNQEGLSRDAEKLLRAKSFEGRRLWFSLADEGTYSKEMKNSVKRVVDTMKRVNAPGLQWTYHPLPAETHASTYLPAATIAFRSLFAKAKAAKKN